ncbi:MAG: T9SS type A sorting domain-containing protein [Bacteroidetes bacterium]|nr:T9SS type A sorting domain-containing protein [Bacteroidota bacterium]
MKKLLLAIFGFLFFGVTYSQKYQPVDSTLVWNTQSSMRISSVYCCYVNEYASFQFNGFVSNNGNTWLKLYQSAIYSRVPCSTPCTDGSVPGNFTNAFRGYVMNDSLNKKVYFTPTLPANYTPTTSNIFYDFNNKTVGDSLSWRSISWSSNNPIYFKILSIDSFQFATNYHKRFRVENNSIFQFQKTIYVMEGMGSALGPWNSIFTDFESGSGLSCFSKPQNVVSLTNYTTFVPTSAVTCGTIDAIPELKPTVFSVYPNPVSSSIIFENIDVSSLSIYDVFGKIVMEQEEINGSVNVQNLAPGIYFLKMRSSNRIFSSKFIKE